MTAAPIVRRSAKIATWSELEDRKPAYALVENVDLVVIRSDEEVSVLYGRCLHRGALLARLNPDKGAVDRVHRRPFLGVAFFKRGAAYRTRLSKEVLREFKARIRELTRRRVGRQMRQVVDELRSYLLGWLGYFGRVDARRLF